ncbi:uncharacterized protein [Ptychodera flava]|uniref:uncharacterized protein n=1 Tax=Ptychodera flava TaxID=63121 RepID=UPI003969FFFA
MDKGKNKGSLSKTFLADIDVFITRCGTLMKPKKAWPYDGNINGYQFANMLQQYVSRFAETEEINVDAVVPTVIEAQLQQVVDLVFTEYRNDMDEYAKTALPCQNYEIIKKHNDSMYQAMRKFKENAKCINDADSRKKYRDALKEELARYSDGDVVGGYLRIILDQNEKMSDEFCKQLVDELFIENSKPGKIHRRQSSGSNIDLLNEQYKEMARGPQMWHVYKTKLADKIEDMSTSRRKEYASFKNNADLNMYVRVKAAEIEELEKKRIKEKILAMEEEEDKTIRAMTVEDIADQLKQSEADFQERSGSTQVQIETLRQTHVGIAKDLQLLLGDMTEEKKKKHDELTRKQEEVMRQS